MKRILSVLVLLLVLSSLRAQDTDRYAIVLSLDAFRWDLTQYARTPNLDAIKQAGTYSEIYPVFPSVTFPNHYSMATGLHPDHHGVTNSTFYDRERDSVFRVADRSSVQDPVFWGGEPIWQTAQRQGMSTHVYMWVGGEAVRDDHNPVAMRPYDGDYPFENRVADVIDAMHSEDIPNLVMFYYEEPDYVQHNYGPNSPEAIAMVERIDSLVGVLMEGVKTSPVYNQINFIITADHGMAEISKDRYINLYHALDNDRIGFVAAATPTFIDPDPDYLDEAYEIISAIDNITVFYRDMMPLEYPQYHYGTNKERIPSLVVLPDVGWIVDYSDHDRPKDGGAHGYDPYHRDMHMIFYGMGPDFKQGYVREEAFQNLNLHVIIAYLLGIEPARGDGNLNPLMDMFVR